MLKTENLTFVYPETNRGINDISFTASPGQTTAILGKSGSGKSTLLSLIYGLLDAQKGSITNGEDELKGPSENIVPGHPFMQLVRQDARVLPNHTVFENIEQAIETSNGEVNKGQIKSLLRSFGLEHVPDNKPGDLSGGQKQKLAIARALAAEPEVLLLDEPFNQIDVLERAVIIERIREYVQKNHRIGIIATHSCDEALDLADHLVVLYEGEKIEEGTPIECYQHPKNAITAAFLGPVNLFKTVQGQFAGKGMKFMLRPEDMSIDEQGHDHRVISSIPVPNGWLVKLRFSKTEVRYVYSDKPIGNGINCGIRAKSKDYHEVRLHA